MKFFFHVFHRSKIAHCHTWWVLIIILFSCHQYCENIRRFFYIYIFCLWSQYSGLFLYACRKDDSICAQNNNNVPVWCWNRRTERVFNLWQMEYGVLNWDICLDLDDQITEAIFINQTKWQQFFKNFVYVKWHNWLLGSHSFGWFVCVVWFGFAVMLYFILYTYLTIRWVINNNSPPYNYTSIVMFCILHHAS